MPSSEISRNAPLAISKGPDTFRQSAPPDETPNTTLSEESSFMPAFSVNSPKSVRALPVAPGLSVLPPAATVNGVRSRPRPPSTTSGSASIHGTDASFASRVNCSALRNTLTLPISWSPARDVELLMVTGRLRISVPLPETMGPISGLFEPNKNLMSTVITPEPARMISCPPLRAALAVGEVKV